MTDKPLPPDERIRTTRVGNLTEHEVYPGMEVCDFCLSTAVAGHYDAGEVRVDTPTATHVGDDGWNACAECHDAIDADSLADLIARAVYGLTTNTDRGTIDVTALVETLSGFMNVKGEWHPL